MIVECVSLIDENGYHANEWLTPSRRYVVLFVSILDTPKFAVLDDSGSYSWWKASVFRTTSTRIPENWGIRVNGDSGVDIGPLSWMRPGFWEELADGVAGAKADFEAQVALTSLANEEAQ